MHHWDIRSSGL